ncbi:MAG TPA: hypothetical protein VFA67_11955 [Candidatus Sulfotelmatobacter sp.]|nr:hypothetical protein [Candidatus Sulfotelmatobacter sp.]
MKNTFRPSHLILALIIFVIPVSSQRGLDQLPAKHEVETHQLVLERPDGPQPVPLNVAELHRDAIDLAQLAQSVARDIDQAAQGKLAKDLPEKLKRIEKLSRRLRGQLAR